MTPSETATRACDILIVDDERNMRRTLASILDREGYRITTASTGEEAVELCSQHRYDIVLMDVRMPGMDGVEAFRHVRRHQESVRVILMSAYSMDELKEAALEEGAIAFLSKPLDVGQLIKLIGEVTDTAVLVVEDDPETLTLLDTRLTERGYKVTTTSSPHDALELVEQIKFDLIFIDAKLPSMTGLDLYLGIKRINPKAVAILISDMDEEFQAIAREAVRQTAYTFVRKPLDIDCILAMLQRIGIQQASQALKKPTLEGEDDH